MHRFLYSYYRFSEGVFRYKLGFAFTDISTSRFVKGFASRHFRCKKGQRFAEYRFSNRKLRLIDCMVISKKASVLLIGLVASLLVCRYQTLQAPNSYPFQIIFCSYSISIVAKLLHSLF